MSYENSMLDKYKMPSHKDIENALLITLFRHKGVIKEFSSGEEVVNEIADLFLLNKIQRTVVLERKYYKENRIVKSPLWHRLLYRSAYSLSKQDLVTNPTLTLKLTNKKEWMLTEKGYDEALKILNIPNQEKELLPVKSYEVQKLVKKIVEAKRPKYYNPFDNNKVVKKVLKETSLRRRGFRQAIIEAYNYKCAFCGMRLNSPDTLYWEVEAAHIIPHSYKGRDDIWNGLALCRLHHWAFDVGWLALNDDYSILVSSKVNSIPEDQGKFGDYDFIRILSQNKFKIYLPSNKEIYPHYNAIIWHRENKFYKKGYD